MRPTWNHNHHLPLVHWLIFSPMVYIQLNKGTSTNILLLCLKAYAWVLLSNSIYHAMNNKYTTTQLNKPILPGRSRSYMELWLQFLFPYLVTVDLNKTLKAINLLSLEFSFSFLTKLGEPFWGFSIPRLFFVLWKMKKIRSFALFNFFLIHHALTGSLPF